MSVISYGNDKFSINNSIFIFLMILLTHISKSVFPTYRQSNRNSSSSNATAKTTTEMGTKARTTTKTGKKQPENQIKKK